MKALIDEIRRSIADMLLRWAVRIMPKDDSYRAGIARGLQEQSAYDRYEAYSLLLKQHPLPFDRWRTQREWIGLKFASTH